MQAEKPETRHSAQDCCEHLLMLRQCRRLVVHVAGKSVAVETLQRGKEEYFL